MESFTEKMRGDGNGCGTEIVSSSRRLSSDMLNYINSKRLCFTYMCCNRLMWMLYVMCQGGEER